MTALLMISLLALLAAAALAGAFAMRASRLGAELDRARSERDDLEGERDRMRVDAEALPEARARLAATEARLEMSEKEKARLLSEERQKSERTHQRVGQMFDDFRSVREETLPQILQKTTAAASGTERIDRGMTGWMQTIANPQARGAFGELAVGEPAAQPGPRAGARLHAPGERRRRRKRPDYIVRTGDGSVIIDAKFVLDEDLRGSTRRSSPRTPSASSGSGGG